MDDRQFDNLARALAHGTSRRAIVKGLAASAASGVAVLLGGRESDAFICRQPGVLCGKDAHCCSGECGADHRCACPNGGLLCGRECVDPTSVDNCGGCGITCSTSANATAACTPGGCSFTCDHGFGDCDGDPANGCELALTTDDHCGACDNACFFGQACLDGACGCNADVCPNGCCTVSGFCLTKNGVGQNCGTGGEVCFFCADGQECLNGECICDSTSCPDGCCDANGNCQGGRSTSACGIGGVSCAACTSDEQCCHGCCPSSCICFGLPPHFGCVEKSSNGTPATVSCSSSAECGPAGNCGAGFCQCGNGESCPAGTQCIQGICAVLCSAG